MSTFCASPKKEVFYVVEHFRSYNLTPETNFEKLGKPAEEHSISFRTKKNHQNRLRHSCTTRKVRFLRSPLIQGAAQYEWHRWKELVKMHKGGARNINLRRAGLAPSYYSWNDWGRVGGSSTNSYSLWCIWMNLVYFDCSRKLRFRCRYHGFIYTA